MPLRGRLRLVGLFLFLERSSRASRKFQDLVQESQITLHTPSQKTPKAAFWPIMRDKARKTPVAKNTTTISAGNPSELTSVESESTMPLKSKREKLKVGKLSLMTRLLNLRKFHLLQSMMLPNMLQFPNWGLLVRLRVLVLLLTISIKH